MIKRNLVSRSDDIETLFQIIRNADDYKENSENGLVILLNGEWGTGKSTFLSEIKNSINKQEDLELFNEYNAYEYDCYDNAYIPLFASISDKIELEKRFSNFIKSISIGSASGLQALISSVFKSFIKNVTKVDLNDVTDELKKVLDEVEDDYLEHFHEFKEHKEYIKDKMNELCKKKKQIFIIDELDRCKPSFAMETLEIVKHFFDIKNCVFIISVDKIQLEESSKAIYGNINSEKYFSKLFDYQFNLLPINFYDAIDLEDQNEELIKLTSKLYGYLNISLRDGKKIFNELISKNNSWTIYQSSFMLFLFILKYTDLSFYNAFLNKDYLKYKELFEGTYNANLEKYKKIFSIKIGNDLTYGEILDEVNFCLNYMWYDLGEVNSNTYVSFSRGSKSESLVGEDVKKYIPLKKYNATLKENIKSIIG